MANTVPAAWPPVEPAVYAPGETIRATDWQRLADASNYLAAHHHARCIVQEYFDPPLTDAGAGWLQMCEWRIPERPGITTADSRVNISRDPAQPLTLEWRSVNAGGALACGAGAVARGWVSASGLALDFGPGYETIQLWGFGDAANPLTTYTAALRYLSRTSPLAAGTVGGTVAFDANELAADEPLSADAIRLLNDNLTAMLGYDQVYAQWSAVTNVASPIAQMPTWLHRVWVPHHSGAEGAGLTVRVYVRTRNVTGATERVRIYHGGDSPRTADHTDIDVAGPAGTVAWYVKDIRLGYSEIRGLPRGIRLSQLGIAPVPTDAAFPAGADFSGHLSTAEILSVSAWGV